MSQRTQNQIVQQVTNAFKSRQWFAGAGYINGKLTIAYNFFPAFEQVEIKEGLRLMGVEAEMKNIKDIMPGGHSDDIPSHMKH